MADIVSNVSGVVMRVLVKEGESVDVDQDIVAIESMKMEMNTKRNELTKMRT